MLKVCPQFLFLWFLIALCLSDYRETVQRKSIFAQNIHSEHTSSCTHWWADFTLTLVSHLFVFETETGEREVETVREGGETKTEVWDTFWHYTAFAKTFSLWELPRHEAWHHFWLHTDYKWRHTVYSVLLVHVCFNVVTVFKMLALLTFFIIPLCISTGLDQVWCKHTQQWLDYNMIRTYRIYFLLKCVKMVFHIQSCTTVFFVWEVLKVFQP